VLLFTDGDVSRPQYLAYKGLFGSLKLSFDMWDVQRQCGISIDKRFVLCCAYLRGVVNSNVLCQSRTNKQHELSWVARYHSALIILCAPVTQLPLLEPLDFVGKAYFYCFIFPFHHVFLFQIISSVLIGDNGQQPSLQQLIVITSMVNCQCFCNCFANLTMLFFS
jgi:hypothetical protein